MTCVVQRSQKNLNSYPHNFLLDGWQRIRIQLQFLRKSTSLNWRMFNPYKRWVQELHERPKCSLSCCLQHRAASQQSSCGHPMMLSHMLFNHPTKTSVGFSATETSWSLWCGTQWNLLVLLLIPRSLLYLPAACCLCLKLNSCSCYSSSALFQSTVSGCKHKKKLRVQEDNNSFWLWVAKRKPKGENLLNPANPREKPI